jgi:hypothetical protein
LASNAAQKLIVDIRKCDIIPLTNKPIAEVIQVIKDKFKKHHGFEAAMDGMDKADYLFDDTAIIKMLDWIKKIK